ncbi:hypothetical protein ACHAQA_007394 [Verticillium albo-atrum]
MFSAHTLHDALRKRRPTYHLAPNFTTRPFPNGYLDLGSIVDDLTCYNPINDVKGHMVPIPDSQRFSDIKEDPRGVHELFFGGEGGMTANLFDQSIGGEVTLKGKKIDEHVCTVTKLETVCFHPRSDYIKACIRLPNVKEFMAGGHFENPVYLVTGLKIAWGATVEKRHRREAGVQAAVGVGVAGVPLAGTVEGSAGVTAVSETAESTGKPADFVLGIQLQKISHRRRYRRGSKVKSSRVFRGAVMFDSGPENLEDTNNEDDYILEDLSDEEVAGLVFLTGEEFEDNL